jgi:hypothetical protein
MITTRSFAPRMRRVHRQAFLRSISSPLVGLLATACLTAAASGSPSGGPVSNCQGSTKACSQIGAMGSAMQNARIQVLVTVGTGRWGTVAWQFKVSEPTSPGFDGGAHGILCHQLILDNQPSPQGCGTFQFFRPTSGTLLQSVLKIPKTRRTTYQDQLLNLLENPAKIQVGWEGGTASPRPAVYGEVISTARALEITFTNNTTLRVAALPPTGKLVRGVAFYAAPMPCNTAVKTIIAIGSKNQIVAKYPPPAINPLMRQVQLSHTVQC